MFRTLLTVGACLSLAGCVTNTVTAQTAQLSASGGGGAAGVLAARPAPPPPRPPVLTPTARIANASLVTVGKTTTSGTTLVLATPQALGRDCVPLGQVDVKVAEPPEHGTVHVAKGSAFSNFVPGDPPYPCNARKTPATIVTYVAEPGFTGQDVAIVQIFFPDGRAPTVRFNIAVR